MTGEKVEEVLQLYYVELSTWLVGAPPRRLTDQEATCRATYLGITKRVDHLKFMCLEAQKFVDEGRLEKAMRWLGFIQGCFWLQGRFSLDDLKNHSRPAT